ncbi:SHOCT domain-containing protein [Catellatospora coxensis]
MDFWDVFWLLLIFIPLLLIWAFAIVDIFRRDDLSGWLKALWIVVVILLPFLGTLIYLIFRQPGATAQERRAMDQASREFVEKYSPSDSAQQLKLLSDLHDRGKLTDAEFAEEKSRVLDAARAHDAARAKDAAPGVPAGQGTPSTGSTASWTRSPDDQSTSWGSGAALARAARPHRPRAPATRPDPPSHPGHGRERAAAPPRGFGA